MSYSAPLRNIEEALHLLAKTTTGTKQLAKFRPIQLSGRVRIEGYPLELLEKLKEATGPDQPIGAAFINDGDQGVIYFDPTAPVGVLAPFLLHEMVHACDERLWKKKPSQKALLEAETSAFNTQRRFVEELGAVDPAYEKFLRSRFPKARILHERLSRGDVAELYGFDDAA